MILTITQVQERPPLVPGSELILLALCLLLLCLLSQSDIPRQDSRHHPFMKWPAVLADRR